MFCLNEDTVDHLFFECGETRYIWGSVLKWLHIQHCPRIWEDELPWTIELGKGKGWKARIFNLALTKMVYGIWEHRNNYYFGKPKEYHQVINGIIEKIVYRGWYYKNTKPHIAIFMAN